MKNVYQFDLFTDQCLHNSNQNIIEKALTILHKSLKTEQMTMNSSVSVKDFCSLKLAQYEHEVFGAIFLDTQHRLIEFKELFRGTINACSVHIREVVKEALALNAAAIIFSHNHPSGIPEPSQSDLQITQKLKSALIMFDIQVLDHVVVSKGGCVSMAERGEI